MRTKSKDGYTHEDKFYPSVTTILKAIKLPNEYELRDRMGANAHEAMMSEKGGLGQEFHDAARLICLGLEPAKSSPRIEQFRKWFCVCVDEVFAVEHEMICEKYEFGGTLDLVCRFKGEKARVLVDYKTGKILPIHYLQLGAYREGYKDETGYDVKRGILLNVKDGGIKPYEAPDMKGDFRYFLYAKEIYNKFWRNQ